MSSIYGGFEGRDAETGEVRGGVDDIFVGSVDLMGGDVFEPVYPVGTCCVINGLVE